MSRLSSGKSAFFARKSTNAMSFRALTKSTRLFATCTTCWGCRAPKGRGNHAAFGAKSRLRKRLGDALRQHAPHIFVKGASLGQAFHCLLHERILFEFDLIACGQSEYGDEGLLLDLSLDPIGIGGQVSVRVADILFIEIAPEERQHLIVYLEIFGDLRFGSEKISGEAADASFKGKEDVPAQQLLLKIIGLGRRDHHI